MKEFITAASDDFGKVDEDDVITTMHDGVEVSFFRPTTAQLAVMSSISPERLEKDPKMTAVFIEMFFEMCDQPTARYYRSRLLDREDPLELENEGGLLDVFENLVEEWSARPTKKPSDYQQSRRGTGRSSTATTRAKASTSSRSRSRASSPSSSSGRSTT